VFVKSFNLILNASFYITTIKIYTALNIKVIVKQIPWNKMLYLNCLQNTKNIAISAKKHHPNVNKTP
jgi:hypothetical protein